MIKIRKIISECKKINVFSVIKINILRLKIEITFLERTIAIFSQIIFVLLFCLEECTIYLHIKFSIVS